MLERVDFSAKKMSKEEYKARHKELVTKLVVLQQQARSKGIGLVVLFEGWAGAGKGTRISDLMYELDARATSVHVSDDVELGSLKDFAGRSWGVRGYYPEMQEFWKSLGERGTITFYDRGWYTTAIAKVFESLAYEKQLAKKEKAKAAKKAVYSEDGASKVRAEFLDDAIGGYQGITHDFEQTLVDDGYVVIKLFVHARKDALKKRLKALQSDPNTAWRASEEKRESIKNYEAAYDLYDQMLESSNYAFAPWTLINGEDARSANVQIAEALIEGIECALAASPDAATEEAKKKAAENSAQAAVGAQGNAEGNQSPDADAVFEAAEAKARDQHAQAPRGSRYLIMAGYPQIDHEKNKPAIATNEEYRAQLKAEQKRFYELELEMYQKRIPLMLMYEGWDAAGKGGNIKRVCQAIDARAYTVFPSPAPTKPELMHPHLWRYWTRLPKAGHVGIYDRSWYGRVLVERVEGFAGVDQWARAYDEINSFEHELVQWGAVLLKFWVDVTPEEQLRRFEARQSDPNKIWKITDEDWRNRDKYPLYKQAVDDMFRLTSTTFAPWIVLESDDKYYARIQALKAVNEALENRMRR